jgi:carbon monoxide dehydrogenase subunit G
VSELVVRVNVAAPAEQVWAALTDWEGHDRWMLFTRAEGEHQEGGSVEAFTGIGPLGFLDTMTIVVWEPPRRAVMRHTGKVVRGSGSFEVESLGLHRSRIVWSEWLDLPLGVVGRAGWRVARPIARWGVTYSLRRLAGAVEAGW